MVTVAGADIPVAVDQVDLLAGAVLAFIPLAEVDFAVDTDMA